MMRHGQGMIAALLLIVSALAGTSAAFAQMPEPDSAQGEAQGQGEAAQTMRGPERSGHGAPAAASRDLGVRKAAPTDPAAALLKRCTGRLEATATRVEGLRKAITQRLGRQERWRGMVEGIVHRWVDEHGPSADELKHCERFARPRLEVRGERLVLRLSGVVVDPDEVADKLKRLRDLLPQIEIDSNGLEPLPGGACRHCGAHWCVADGSKLFNYDKVTDPIIAALPPARDCARIGRKLAAAGDGKGDGEGATDDFWVQSDGDAALCVRDGKDWYARRTQLDSFTGLVLSRQ